MRKQSTWGPSPEDLAKEIWQKKPQNRYDTTYADNWLLTLLWNRYESIVESNLPFLDIQNLGHATEACNLLYVWYHRRYPKTEHDSRGRTTVVTFKNTYDTPQSKISTYSEVDGAYIKGKEKKDLYGSYAFGDPYEKRQFMKYLASEEIPQTNPDFLGFLLHTAVAFMVAPQDLERVLKQYGFQQLHVRNIHHLAIYTVLSEASELNAKELEEFDPFARIATLYHGAREILNEPELKKLQDKNFFFEGEYTAEVRSYLFQKKNICSERFMSLIRDNKDKFTMIHHRVLEDYHKLTSVFLYIFEEDNPESDSCRASKEQGFSFYAFTNSFAFSASISWKEFRKRLQKIDTEQKQPTRECMILLWLYAFCFSFTPGIAVGPDILDKIARKLSRYNKSWDIGKYYKSDYLDVSGFLNSSSGYDPFKNFKGSDLIAYLSSTLSERYEWDVLRPNSKRPFDYYLTRLSNLRIEKESLYYDGVKISDISTQVNVDAVPYPLVAITTFLNMIKACEDKPLNCRLYEQI